MNVTGTTGTTATTAGASGSAASAGVSKNFDKDTFLKLLVAQLKYQDPTKPADATEFMSQTAQFTVVEKLESLSALDQKVLDATRSQSAAALIGQTVTWADVSGMTRSGTVTGTTLGAQPTLTVDGNQVALEAVTAVGRTTGTTTGTTTGQA